MIKTIHWSKPHFQSEEAYTKHTDALQIHYFFTLLGGVKKRDIDMVFSGASGGIANNVLVEDCVSFWGTTNGRLMIFGMQLD